MKAIAETLNARAVKVTVFSSLLVFGLASGPLSAQQSSGSQPEQSAQPITQPGQEQQSAQISTPPGQGQQAKAGGPDITVKDQPPEVQVKQPEPKVQVEQQQPKVIVRQPQPEVQVIQPEPKVDVSQAQPEVNVKDRPPEVQVQQEKPQIQVERSQQQAEVQVQREGQPQVQVEQPQGQAQVEVVPAKPGESQSAQSSQSPSEQQSQQAQSQPSSSQSAEVAQLQQRTGDKLYSDTGEELGTIKELARDKQTGKTVAIVSSGGVLGVGGERIAVPVDQMKVEGDRVTTSVASSKKEFEQMAAAGTEQYETLPQGQNPRG